jgi:ABC-type dipeptide/oligopeptide/nickel transport system permease component
MLLRSSLGRDGPGCDTGIGSCLFYDQRMKSLTILFYAVATFMLGVIALGTIPIAFQSTYGSTQTQLAESIVGALTLVLPILFLAAIPFAGTRRGE